MVQINDLKAMNIDIYTCIAPNSAPYAEALYENMESLKSGVHNIRYWGMIAAQDAKVETFPKGWAFIPVNTQKEFPTKEPEASQPSVRHAKLINGIGTSRVALNSDITIIVDCDMYVFMPDWDIEIVNQLKLYDCVGTPKHDRVLHMYFMAMETEKFRKCNFDFMPGESAVDFVCRWKAIKASAKNFQVRPGTSIVTDTGWRISDQLAKAGMKYMKWNYSESNGDVPYRYYIITDRATLFCAHFGGSHKREFNGAECQKWYADCKILIGK